MRPAAPGAPGLLRKFQSTPPVRSFRPTRWVYLHGFASSPKSQKAQFFRRMFSGVGMQLVVPDLNVPTFSEMTVTSALSEVSRVVTSYPEGTDVGIIGSSLGGLLAIFAAGRHRSVKRLLLLAPALSLFRENYVGMGKAGVRKWERDGYVMVHHHGENRQCRVNFSIVDNARNYDERDTELSIPVTIYHGTRDEIVDSHHSVEYSRERENVDLHLVDDDHTLMDSMPEIWERLWKEIRPRS